MNKTCVKSDKVEFQESPLLLDVKEAARLLSIGRTLFLTMDSDGRLGPLGLHLGRRKLWRRAELENWIEAGCPDRVKWVKNK